MIFKDRLVKFITSRVTRSGYYCKVDGYKIEIDLDKKFDAKAPKKKAKKLDKETPKPESEAVFEDNK